MLLYVIIVAVASNGIRIATKEYVDSKVNNSNIEIVSNNDNVTRKYFDLKCICYSDEFRGGWVVVNLSKVDTTFDQIKDNVIVVEFDNEANYRFGFDVNHEPVGSYCQFATVSGNKRYIRCFYDSQQVISHIEIHSLLNTNYFPKFNKMEIYYEVFHDKDEGKVYSVDKLQQVVGNEVNVLNSKIFEVNNKLNEITNGLLNTDNVKGSVSVEEFVELKYVNSGTNQYTFTDSKSFNNALVNDGKNRLYVEFSINSSGLIKVYCNYESRSGSKISFRISEYLTIASSNNVFEYLYFVFNSGNADVTSNSFQVKCGNSNSNSVAALFKIKYLALQSKSFNGTSVYNTEVVDYLFNSSSSRNNNIFTVDENGSNEKQLSKLNVVGSSGYVYDKGKVDIIQQQLDNKIKSSSNSYVRNCRVVDSSNKDSFTFVVDLVFHNDKSYYYYTYDEDSLYNKFIENGITIEGNYLTNILNGEYKYSEQQFNTNYKVFKRNNEDEFVVAICNSSNGNRCINEIICVKQSNVNDNYVSISGNIVNFTLTTVKFIDKVDDSLIPTVRTVKALQNSVATGGSGESSSSGEKGITTFDVMRLIAEQNTAKEIINEAISSWRKYECNINVNGDGSFNFVIDNEELDLEIVSNSPYEGVVFDRKLPLQVGGAAVPIHFYSIIKSWRNINGDFNSFKSNYVKYIGTIGTMQEEKALFYEFASKIILNLNVKGNRDIYNFTFPPYDCINGLILYPYNKGELTIYYITKKFE